MILITEIGAHSLLEMIEFILNALWNTYGLTRCETIWKQKLFEMQAYFIARRIWNFATFWKQNGVDHL